MHYTVLVVGENPEESLAPFNENLDEDYTDKGKWDWYQLGGRWRNFFKLKEEKTGINGSNPGLYYPPTKEGFADQVKKGDIGGEIKTTYAVLIEGEWLCRDDFLDWEQKFREIIHNLPEDTLLSLYDCHS